jgi:hypothetical protein
MPPQHPNPRQRPGSDPRPRPGSQPRPKSGPRPGSDPGSDPGASRRAGWGTPPLPNRTNWSATVGGSAAMVRALGGWLLAAATGEAGRRLARAVGLTVVLAALVTTLYDRGEVPSAAARPAVGAPAAGAAGQQERAGSAHRKDPRELGGLRGRERPSRVGERPAAVAADWYAARHGVPRAKVKPLQQDRLSAREVRVLVMADHGRGRLRTALVRVRLGTAGWSVR